MTVKEFLEFEKSGAMVRVYDASKQGYMSFSAKEKYEADKHTVSKMFGDSEVVGFAPCGKVTIKLYIIEK